MPGVFISYRREDSSGYAGRLFDILSSRFGKANTFMDLDTIQGGDNFTQVIDDKLKASSVLVAVIGPHWLTPRLNAPEDFVCLEISKALASGIRVIPVLVGGAVLPSPKDLPEAIRPLCDRQAVEVRDAQFHADTEQLIAVIHRAIPRVNVRAILSAVLALALVIFGVALFRHPQSVAGKWTATVKYDWGDTYKEAFNFQVDGADLSGTASFLGGDRGILDGKIHGNHVSFTTKSLSTLGADPKTYEDKHLYKGIVENGTIQFTMLTDSEMESHAPIHFTASKVN